MTCEACGEQPKKVCNDFTKAVIEINNPETIVLLRKVVMPASMPEADNPPAVGKYRNVILKYEDTGNVYIYSSDGIPTAIEANVPQEVLDRIESLDDKIDLTAENLSSETLAREAADDQIEIEIDGLSGDLETEANTRGQADTALGNRVTAIEGKIPSQASAQNQLADKDFVNSSIATNTANFIGTFNSVAELEAYTGTVTNNDYAFVIVTDAQGNTAYDRYKYNGDTEQWIFEYELNNSSFTAEQWAAINSGITSGDASKIQGLANIQSVGTGLSLVNGELSATGGGGPTVVQTAGTSTTDVMSQNATTSMVFADPSFRTRPCIGKDALVDANGGIAIGSNAVSRGQGIVIGGNSSTLGSSGVCIGTQTSVRNYGVGIGLAANTSANGAIALGAWSAATQTGEMNIGSTNATYGYNNSNYRLLSGLYDGQNDHDAATKGQLDTATANIPIITMTTTDPGEGSTLAENHFVGVYGDDPIVMDYSTNEINTGAKWIDGTDIYKKTINFGALPNNSNKTVAHGITNLSKVIELKGYTSNGTTFTPLPMASTTGAPTAVFVDSTNIVYTTSSDRTSYTETYITIYYTKSS